MLGMLRLAGILGVFGLVACAAGPDTRTKDAETIHALVREWCAASQAKDPVRFTAVYAEDARVMLEGAPDLCGLPAIREGITGMMQDPNFALHFEAEEVVVARSGDLAYETGTYGMTMTGPEGAPLPEKGHYLVLWGKQSDGSWKVLVDTPVSDSK